MRAIYHHRVVDRRDPHDVYAASTIEASELDAQASELARHWHVVSLEEVHQHLVSGQPLPPDAVHLSFDDGYRDNLLAAEILASHGLPWTLFVVADAVLDGFVPWYVRLAGALAASSGTVQWDGAAYDLGRAADVDRFKQRAKQAVMSAPASRHLAVLDEILDRPGVDEPESPAWPFLSVQELRHLAGSGVEIGNHSATHPNLTRCGGDDLAREVVRSQQRLAEAVGRPVRSFAYPDGRWDRDVIDAVGATHDLAMATWTGRRPLDPLRLRRFPAGSSVAELREVLSPGYPARFRARRARWSLRRSARLALGGRRRAA